MNETISAVRFSELLLIVGPPSKKPPIIAPTMPTTMFNSAPCCASVRITMLASQPISAPISNQMIRLIMVGNSSSEVPLDAELHPYVCCNMQAACHQIGHRINGGMASLAPVAA